MEAFLVRHDISDEGDPKQYFTILPNIVFELGLKPMELTLYAHIKRAAGANAKGRCFKSTATLAKETGMGAGTVSRTKTALETKRSSLGNRPLIRTKEVPNPKGGKPFQEITITDIWKANADHFPSSTLEIETPKPSSTLEVDSQNQVPNETKPSSKPTSTVEIKKNVEEEHTEEERTVRASRVPESFSVTPEMRSFAERETPDVNIRAALDEFMDYWRGVPGAKGVKQDWIGTWRNRMRTLQERAAQGRSNGHRTQAEMNSAGSDKLVY